MNPVIALVGQPNVGKSTLFNRLTRSRAALVADQPGLTRDRIYGAGKVGGRPYIVIDTGGLTGDVDGVEAQMEGQSYRAMEEADAVLFLVDGRKGLTALDESVALHLRRLGKPVFLVVNKTEGMEADIVTAEFQSLALGAPHAVSAAHGDGVDALMDVALAAFPVEAEMQRQEEITGIKVAVIGRPNVGKSTLVNRMLGEERVVVFDEAGTTRDSIYIPFVRDEQHYTLIDTAGVRRRGRVTEMIEKFSIVKTLQAIEDANVVILVLDASTGISAQDTHLAGFIMESGRALVIAVNKWDGLPSDQRERVKQEIDRKFPFLGFATIHFISALHGTGVGHLFDSVCQAYESATAKLATPRLTRLLQDAVSQNPPPLVKGRRIKLRYAHQGGDNPPIIVIHGNQTGDVPDSYRSYLSNVFRKVLELEGTPVRIEFRSGENPYRDKKQTLTKRQQNNRRREKRRMKKKYG